MKELAFSLAPLVTLIIGIWLGKLSERHSRKAVKAEYDWWRSEIVDHSPEPGFRRAGL